MKNNKRLMDVLLQDQDRTGAVFQPGPCWKDYANRITYFIRRDGIERFRDHEGVGKGYADSLLTDPFDALPGNAKALWLKKGLEAVPMIGQKILNPYRQMLAKYINRSIALEGELMRHTHKSVIDANRALLAAIDTVAASPRKTMDIGGKPVAFSYIDGLRRLDIAGRNIDWTGKTGFVEIGGGFGAQTHLVLEKYRGIKTALYVDLAPMLYVGTEYLRHHYPDRVVDYLEAQRTLTEGSGDFTGKIACLPPFMLDRIRLPWDVAWNACSFQEMTREQILAYLAWLKANAMAGAVLVALIYPDPSGRTLSPAQFIEIAGQGGFIAVHDVFYDENGFGYVWLTMRQAV